MKFLGETPMHPIHIDDDNLIHKTDSAFKGILRGMASQIWNQSLVVSKIWMNEDDYKDIIEVTEITCDYE